MKIGKLYKINSAYIDVSIMYKNIHNIWVKGNDKASSYYDDYGVRYKTVKVDQPAMFIGDYIGKSGIFLVEDQYVELNYTDLEAL